MKHTAGLFPNTEVRFLGGFHVPGYCETDGTASMMIPEGLPFYHGAKIRIACESALAQTADFAVPPLITATEQMLVPLPEEYYFTLSRECELWPLMLVSSFLES
jgi:hypothetical protein